MEQDRKSDKLAMKWIVDSATKRNEKTMKERVLMKQLMHSIIKEMQ